MCETSVSIPFLTHTQSRGFYHHLLRTSVAVAREPVAEVAWRMALQNEL